MERKAYKVDEVAEMLGLCTESVRRLVRRGELRAVYLSKPRFEKMPSKSVIRIPADAIDEFLKGGTPNASDRSEATDPKYIEDQ